MEKSALLEILAAGNAACLQAYTALSRARWLLGGEVSANAGLADSQKNTATSKLVAQCQSAGYPRSRIFIRMEAVV